MGPYQAGAGYDLAPVLAFDELDSTNAEARRLAEQGAEGPLWIKAKVQTAGRGRRGRNWASPQGNLCATWLGVLPVSPLKGAELSFVAALAVHDTLTTWVPEALVRIKWPNDVLIDGKKTCGILIESGQRPDQSLWFAVGIGINVETAPQGLERPTTRLIDHLGGQIGQAPKVDAVLSTLNAAFHRWLGIWIDQGFLALRSAWLSRAMGMGLPCTARLGQETLEGIMRDLGEDGALILELASGQRRSITAGDVFF